ncbi:MAG: DUF763 domain-containing protein [Phycisphaerae bacterium]
MPLHGGKAPPWLFKRMKKLAGAITMAVVDQYGPEEMLRRLSDPWWFQAFGCVLGFDWHSSGVTTVTCGALKEASKLYGDDMGIIVAGGKGGTSRKTPDEIATAADRLSLASADKLIHASRMSAKVDSAAVQDGFDIYHHSFLFARSGSWCVIQQGMSDTAGAARRYHWLGQSVDDFVCQPHHGIEDLFEKRKRPRQLNLLNMVAAEAEGNRSASAELIKENPDKLLAELELATRGPTLFAPDHHPVLDADVNLPRIGKLIRRAHEQHPQDFATLLGGPGVGPATIRSLSLLAELIHNAPASRRDPTEPPSTQDERKWADYSYAHGGKDGFPFPVDKRTYDRSTDVLLQAVRQARLGQTDKQDAITRLGKIAEI